MKIIGPLIKGKFVARPNRFMTDIELSSGIVESHLPDPGRLLELLIPGTNVWLRPAPKNSDRKTKFSTVMVEKEGVLISLDTTLPNRFIKEELSKGSIPMLNRWSIIKQEYKMGNHRIDFLLNNPDGEDVFTEIKSVTYVEDATAMFPDAVTDRGKKHVKLLSSLTKDGKRTQIIFICQRPDAEIFQPMWDRDPSFSKALADAKQAGVDIKCFTTNVTLKEITFCKEIPLNLTPPDEQ